MEGATAAASRSNAEYLGMHATVMDAELLGICLALESNHTKIALDSQAAMTRAALLYTEPARSWIGLRLQKACRMKSTIAWVKGHYGVVGNEEADRRANTRAYGGRVMGLADVMTPAGIRQDYPIHTKPKHIMWSKKVLKGFVYVSTDRGPMKSWLKVIGRSQDDLCECGEVQNAVHLRECRLVGDGKGRTLAQCQQDMEWCEAVADFLL